MKFITNHISTSNNDDSKTFNDVLAGFNAKGSLTVIQGPGKTLEKIAEEQLAIKTASTKETVKVAKPEVKDEKVEDTKDEKVEVKDEKVEVKDETTKAVKAEKGQGPSSGQLDVEPLHQKGESTNQPKGSDAGEKEKPVSSGQPEAEGKLTNDPKVEKEAKTIDKKEDEIEIEKKDKDKKEEVKAENKETKTAVKEKKYVKLANLDEKSKSFLREYWLKQYPAEFVDAMLADK